jgi:guanosine-3',5'-bis(diphosphate) 3'-pyrophosphohydrolase
MNNLIQQAISLVCSAFAGKPDRFGPYPIPASLHSLRVGHDLISYGFTLETSLGGFTHDLTEDCDLLPNDLQNQFGAKVATYVSLCSLHPRFDGKHSDESEDELFSRVMSWVEEGQDVEPLAIKCADSMDAMRFLAYCPSDWHIPLLLRASRWLETGRQHGLPKPMMDEFERLIRLAEQQTTVV